MLHRQLGSSDLNVPVVSFGAWAVGGWRWGGAFDDRGAIRAMQRGIDLGVTCIDTAPIYGMGHSERLVGQAIRGRRDRVIVATKCGVRWDLKDVGQHVFDTVTREGVPAQVRRYLGKEHVKKECDESLQRLGIDAIDLYQCHQPDPTTPLAETMEGLLDLQRAGKIRHIGVSNFTPEMMEECLRQGPIVSDQPIYNPLQRGIEKDVLPFCRTRGVGLLVYSPIAQGLMTGKVTMDREFEAKDNRRDKPWFQPRNRRRVLDMLEKIRPIADGHGATLGQLAINWVFSQDGITTALVGARDEKQVEENAGAANFTLKPEEIAFIRKAVEDLGDPLP